MLKEVALTILLGTAAMTASSAPPRSKPTVAQVMKLSIIKRAGYTVEEQILLDRVRSSPKRTRDALLSMHEKRLAMAVRAKEQIAEVPIRLRSSEVSDFYIHLLGVIPEIEEAIMELEEMTF